MPQDASTDPFDRPSRGGFARLEDLNHRLLLVKPEKIERGVAGKFGPQDRVTADVVVLDDPESPDGVSEYPKTYLSQKGMVGMLEKCLKPGAKPFILGRLEMTATGDWSEKAEAHPNGIEGMLEDYYKKGGKGEKPQFYWNLADFSDDDANLARTYLAKNDAFTTSG